MIETLIVKTRAMSTKEWTAICGLVGAVIALGATIAIYLDFPQAIVEPLLIFILFAVTVMCGIGAIRQEFFQYIIVRGRTAVILNILMIIFMWSIVIALLISWLAKQ